MRKFLITRSPEIASYAEDCGVEVVFVDLEVHGKAERQKNQHTPINSHTAEDAYAIKKVLKKSALLVRVNPLHEDSKGEINRVIEAGADIIMLPFFSHPDDVLPLVNYIDGRAKVSLLFETPQSIFRFQHFLDQVKFDEAHFGLNDLRILTGLKFLFETLSGGVLEAPIRSLQDRKIPYGIGGIGRSGLAMVNPDAIIGEYARLGSSRVILSRAFAGEVNNLDELKASLDLRTELDLINAKYHKALQRDPAQIEKDRSSFRALIYQTVKGLS
jgi:hypothetical protein